MYDLPWILGEVLTRLWTLAVDLAPAFCSLPAKFWAWRIHMHAKASDVVQYGVSPHPKMLQITSLTKWNLVQPVTNKHTTMSAVITLSVPCPLHCQ
jgi:hypothetical protein